MSKHVVKGLARHAKWEKKQRFENIFYNEKSIQKLAKQMYKTNQNAVVENCVRNDIDEFSLSVKENMKVWTMPGCWMWSLNGQATYNRSFSTSHGSGHVSWYTTSFTSWCGIGTSDAILIVCQLHDKYNHYKQAFTLIDLEKAFDQAWRNGQCVSSRDIYILSTSEVVCLSTGSTVYIRSGFWVGMHQDSVLRPLLLILMHRLCHVLCIKFKWT